MVPRACLLAVLLVLPLAGCTGKDDGKGSGTLLGPANPHCHAEHKSLLNPENGDPWRYQKSATEEPNSTRVYAWTLGRTGGCVTDAADVDLAFQAMLVTTTDRCAGVGLDYATFTGEFTLAGTRTSTNAFRGTSQGNQTYWSYDAPADYPPDTRGDQPQAWNMTWKLRVVHDELLLASLADDCMHRALRSLSMTGTDHDFKT